MDSKEQSHKKDIQVIGHRGHVSHFPENSIEGFLSLAKMGADGLELDLVISGDRKVVVSHEPYMAASYMLTPHGSRIRKSEEKDHLLYKMTYDHIRSFDSGSLRNIRFPKQKNTVAYKPLLTEVFMQVEDCLKEKKNSFTYYLELKSVPVEYGISQPYPEEFADLVMEVVKENQIPGRVILKSFDANLLNVIHEKYPEARISYLLYKTTVEEGLALLNFKPEIISPHFRMLPNKEELLKLQEQDFKVIAWTVNQEQHIRTMMDLGVDGIISDYPERVLKEKKIRFG